MNAHLYRAALYCDGCADAIRARLPLPPGYGADDESSWDSDAYPKGPFREGGGEADTPQHCDGCGVFLENMLTPEGDRYVRGAARPYETRPDMSWDEIAQVAEASGDNGPDVAEWVRFYFAPGQ